MPITGQHAEDRSISAMGERVARVETKIEGIEKDTGIIRSTLHGVNGELQKIVGKEERREATLKTIADQTAALPGLMAKVLLFEELRPQLETLFEENHARKGAGRAMMALGAAAVGAVTIMGGVGAGIIWLIEVLVGRHQ